MWSAVVSLVIGCVVIIDGELYPEELESTSECAYVVRIVPHLVVYIMVHFRLILQRQEDIFSTGS